MWGPIIGAGISTIGGLIGGAMQQSSQLGISREYMDWMERMSSTAHQREVEDLRKAGLNPILSAKLGGASSPTGNAPTMQNWVGDAVKNGVNTALAYKVADAQIENINANTVKTLSEADSAAQNAELLRKFGSAERFAGLEKTYGDVNVSKAMVPKLAADTGLSWKSVEKMAVDMDMTAAQIIQIAKQGNLTDAQIRQANTVNELLRLQFPSAMAHARRGEIEHKFYSSKWGEEATRMGLFAGQSGLGTMTNSAKDLGLMLMLRR